MSQPESGTRGARSQSRRLAVIDGLRGVAILAVMSQHSLARYTGPGSELLGVGSAALPVWAPLSNGWLGVSLFFVLSGFVLYAPYTSGARQMPDVIVPLLDNTFQLGCGLALLALLTIRSLLLRSAFAHSPLQVLVMMCYSLYLWHGVTLRGVGRYRHPTEDLLA